MGEQKKRNKFVSFLIAVGKFLLDILLRVVFAFRDIAIAIWRGLKSIGRFCVRFAKRFKDSSLWTKIGHVIMGAGNFAHKQIVKGCIFLGLEILFILYLVLSPTINGVPSGAKAVGNFFSLGHDKAMPVSREPLDAEMIKLDGRNVEYDLTDKENNNSQITGTVRSINVINQYLNGGASESFIIEDNTGQVKEYKVLDENGNETLDIHGNVYKKSVSYNPTVSKKVIYDRRYVSGDNYDFYGFSEYNSTQLNAVAIGGGSSQIFIIRANKELSINNDTLYVDGKNTDQSQSLMFNNEGRGGRFQFYKYNGKEFGDNTYILVATSLSRKVSNLDLSFLDGIQNVYTIKFTTGAVETAVDNSFLMMLFGLVSFAIIALFIIVWNLSIASAYKADLDVREGGKPTTFKYDARTLLDSRFHITLLTPAILLILIFTIIPTILMILIAFTNMDKASMISGQRLVSWVGFDNFVSLFNTGSGDKLATEVGRNFGGVLGWTFIWAIIATFSCYFGGIFLALLLNRKDVKLKKMWRTIFILTIAIPQFITFLILRNMLTSSGPINSLLQTLHLTKEPVDFLQSSSGYLAATGESGRVWLARVTVLVINLYVGIPYTMLMTSGILMNIPADLYEAATIDGANKWQMFRKITLPYIIFVTTPYLISSFIGNITSFNTIFLTTGGGPSVEGSIAGKTDLLVTWLYKMTINENVYNAGSIIGILTFLITAFLTLVAYRNSKAYKEEDTFQ